MLLIEAYALFLFLKFICLFIWLQQVLIVALGIFCCGMWDQAP